MSKIDRRLETAIRLLTAFGQGISYAEELASFQRPGSHPERLQQAIVRSARRAKLDEIAGAISDLKELGAEHGGRVS